MKKRIMKKVVLAGMVVMMGVQMLAGCGDTSGGGGTEDSVTIATSFPMSGAMAANGKPCVDAINLAVKQANDKGGINGKSIKVVSEDDEASPTSAASIANKFIGNDSIVSVITSFNSSCMLAQVGVFKDAGLSSVSPVATSPQLTGVSDCFYRTAPSDAFCGASAAEFLKKKGLSKIALFYENDDYGLGIADAFTSKCAEIGLEIVTTQTYVYGETVDFSTQLTSTAASGAEGIFVAGCVTEQALICDQRGDYGCENMCVLLGNGAYVSTLLEHNTEGVYVEGEFDTTMSDLAAQFVKDFHAEYGYEPGNWEASAYDAACIVIEAMKKVDGELTRDAVNKALAQTDYPGVCGKYAFVNCDCTKEELIFQVTDGEFKLVN